MLNIGSSQGRWLLLSAIFLSTVDCVAPGRVGASIVSISDPSKGNIIDASAGGTKANHFQDTGAHPKVHAWNEAQGFKLTSDLFVDINTSGTFSRNSDLAGFKAAKIDAQTVVDSQYLYFDPKVSGHVSDLTITFSGKILGVIVESDRFWDNRNDHNYTDYFRLSDILATSPTANNATAHFNNRGLELGLLTDSISVSISGNSLTINDFRAGNPGDQIRIITAAAVPEPSTFLAFGVPAALFGLVHLRRRASRA